VDQGNEIFWLGALTMKAFIIAETGIVHDGLDGLLNHLGAPTWNTNTGNAAAVLSEVAGRLCYKSFGTELNPNITKVREGNWEYLGNVMKQKHGSIFEHSSTSVAFCDVSRILTHELVRHRPGMAYSQESQRFVRLDSFDVWIPDLTSALGELFDHNKEYLGEERETWIQEAQQQFVDNVSEISAHAKTAINDMIHDWGIDNDGVSFHIKKSLTSAMRRMVPGGVNTNIIVTGNHRAWRHVIENRTSPGAEIEIVEAFGNVADQFLIRYPALYQDMIMEAHPDLMHLHYKFRNSKI